MSSTEQTTDVMKLYRAVCALNEGVKQGAIDGEAYRDFMNGLIQPERFLFLRGQVFLKDPNLQQKLAAIDVEAFSTALEATHFPEAYKKAAQSALAQEMPTYTVQTALAAAPAQDVSHHR